MTHTANLLNAMTHAKLCAEYLIAAHCLWLAGPYGRARELAEIKLAAARDQFVKLAASLGYRVEKIEAPADQVAA